MTSWVLTISEKFVHHWGIAKSQMLWDMRTPRAIDAGDTVYFWGSGGHGFVGRAEVDAGARPLQDNDRRPWSDTAHYTTRITFRAVEDATGDPLRWSDVMAATPFRENPSFAYHSSDSVVEHALAALFGAPLNKGDAVPDADAAAGLLSDLAIDRRTRTLAAIALRRGQAGFRNRLLAAYGGQCAVTGTEAQEVLEAAHISPYRGDHTNVTANGLLLRSDVHTLFDLHLLTVVPSHGSALVRVATTVQSRVYRQLDRSPVRAPGTRTDRPASELLREHNAACVWLS